ncbi:MAG: long-chain fatty acid--CoA ligase [Acidobacteria bacterium]|nr:long-chain fatty acid--CoA ligase [Acidobacteriota bacterium]
MLAPAPLQADNLSDFFFTSAAAHASLPILRRRQGGSFSRMTYREAAEQVRYLAAGLTLLGVRRGDRVGLVSENWDRWLLADLAILACGAVDVPRPSRLTSEELAMTLAHAGCRFILVAGPEELARVESMRRHLPGLVDVVDLSDGRDPRHTARSFSELVEAGRKALDQGRLPENFPVPDVGRDDLATIVYTSGTTGRPKGVMLTHGNILSNIAAILTVIQIPTGESLLSILPSWHMYERTVEYAGLGSGAEIVYSSLRTLKDDLRQVRPGFLASVPRLWASIHQRAMAAIAEASPLRRGLALAAWSAGTRAVLARRVLAGEASTGSGPQRPGRLRALLEYLAFTPILHLVTRGLVFHRVRAATGGRLRGALSGGATLSLDLDLFFEVVGLRLLNGYGLTETSPVLTCRQFSHNIPGTVGRPLPGTEVRIVDESGGDQPAGRQGRILVRGPQVMRGYYRDPEATAAVLDREGWFDTGDLGRLLAGGDLILTGRLKDTIVLANGENVEPEPIEERIKSSRYVDQVMVVGQDRDYLAALVVPASAELRSWARRHGRPDVAPAALAADTEVQNLMRRQVARRAGSGSGCRPAEVVKKIHLLPREFSVDDGTLTPTLKVRRPAVLRLYRREIDDLFRPSSS